MEQILAGGGTPFLSLSTKVEQNKLNLVPQNSSFTSPSETRADLPQMFIFEI